MRIRHDECRRIGGHHFSGAHITERKEPEVSKLSIFGEVADACLHRILK